MTHMRCGGIFSDSTITNFSLIVRRKKFASFFGPFCIVGSVYDTRRMNFYDCTLSRNAAKFDFFRSI